MTLASRLWIYQSERFPLKKTVPLLAVFSASSVCVSALLADRPLPPWPAFVAGFIVALALFFQMRVCDEWKDAEHDRRNRPDRPVPRGLVTLPLLFTLAAATGLAAVGVVLAWSSSAIWLLLLVWAYLATMTIEFGVPSWLNARPILYLLSHMAIMPLIDLALTGMEWVPGGGAASGLWLFLALSFVNGCVLEIGRKLWAPENEIEGVDSYSSLWGAKRASVVWLGCVFISFLLLVAVGNATGNFAATTILGALALAVCAAEALRYRSAPTPAAQHRMDALAGLWVFFCYAMAGFLPFAVKVIV